MEKEEMEWKDGKGPSSQKTTVNMQETSKSVSTCIENGIPAGLEALFSACRQLYPNQPNPLQVTALVKYWLGGPDPLDYISMYEHPGNPKLNIPPHWHYISFGLSDIHGDGRVHEYTGSDQASGFGFELTMRLKKESTDKSPPTWPAAILQGLAKYVFQSESLLCVDDHVSWHAPLDGSESRLQHMLMAEDPQLCAVSTPNGRVQFVQVVGITAEELRAVQHWNGAGVLNIMRRNASTGGPYLVTDMRRGESMYDVDPGVAEEVEAGIEEHGSNLSGVSARLAWSTLEECECVGKEDNPRVTVDETEQIRCMLEKGLLASHTQPDTHRATEVNQQQDKEKQQSAPAELLETRSLPSLHVTINLESGALLPLALRGRLKHGRHFTFKSVVGSKAVTLVAPGVSGALVSPEHPYTVRGPWLQALVPPDLLDKMSQDLASLADPDEVKVPVMFQWPSHKLSITVVGEDS